MTAAADPPRPTGRRASYVPVPHRRRRARARSSRCETLGTSVFVTDLEIATASYERQVDELVAEDEDTAAYVRDLETEWDEAEDDDLEDDPSCWSPRSRNSARRRLSGAGGSKTQRLLDPGGHLVGDVEADRLVEDLMTEAVVDLRTAAPTPAARAQTGTSRSTSP